MKKITYIENVFSNSLLQRIITLKNNVVWQENKGRSEISDKIRFLDLDLFNDIISQINLVNNIEIEECDLRFYKRHTKIFNPHQDESKFNFLVFLDGGMHSLENGTIFFSENLKGKISLNIANVINSGVFFPSNYWHTSAQSIFENTSERYTLNCFIESYKEVK